MKQYLLILLLLIASSCDEPIKNKETQIPSRQSSIKKSDSQSADKTQILIDDVVSVSNFCPNVTVDLKYASTDNFMNQVLYFSWKDAYLQKDAAMKLNAAQTHLSQLYPNYHLLIYDAARPVLVQQRMWKALDTIPVKDRVKFVSNPKNKSLHNFGCALDLTITDANNVPLDMGAGFDDIREIAYPSKENYFLNKGLLTVHQIQNRKILRKVMKRAGFTGIPTEWWHFNSCSREFAILNYRLIESEAQINK